MAWFTSRHLRADCPYTGISSGPNARNKYRKSLPFYLFTCPSPARGEQWKDTCKTSQLLWLVVQWQRQLTADNLTSTLSRHCLTTASAGQLCVTRSSSIQLPVNTSTFSTPIGSHSSIQLPVNIITFNRMGTTRKQTRTTAMVITARWPQVSHTAFSYSTYSRRRVIGCCRRSALLWLVGRGLKKVKVAHTRKLVAALLRVVRVTGGKYWQPTAGFMTHVTCRWTAKNLELLRDPMLGSRVWATFTFLPLAQHYLSLT